MAGLRAAGVRISIAECQDAFRATRSLGILERAGFQDGLRATLIKRVADQPTFDYLFPLYFGRAAPPLTNLLDDLSPSEKKTLARATRALLEQIRQQRAQQKQRGYSPFQSQWGSLMQLLQWLLQGQSVGQQSLERAGTESGLPHADHSSQQHWMEQRMLHALGLELLRDLLAQLPATLKELGMGEQTIAQLLQGMEENRAALAEQVVHYVSTTIARQRAESHQTHKQQAADLMKHPFKSLSDSEAQLLRDQVRRLAAQLRSRAALRRKKGKSGTLDAKKTLRTNLRYGGVPLELKYKLRHLKPKLLLICDISTSMRPVVSFLLRMVYELHDQVASTHSFAFIDDMESISADFAEYPPDMAVEVVLRRIPPGHFRTDLGQSLHTLLLRHADTITPQTTVVFVGDGRNNYNNPRLDIMEQIKRRSKRIIWLNPEHSQRWGTDDSDMLAYLPYVNAVHHVSNMAELAQAVDRLL